MKIMAFGKKMSGELLFAPMDEGVVARALAAALSRNAPALETLTVATSRGVAYRGEVDRRVLDVGDPREAGWTYLVAEGDPHRAEVVEILRPLAEHRGMEDPAAPLVFGDVAEDGWAEWLEADYYGRELVGKRTPKYVLMVGGPDRLPFRLQSLLDAVACVGRVQFDSLDDLRTYVGKLLRLETAPEPVVERQAVVFAPDGGMQDPTYFSREYMARPLRDYIQQQLGFQATALMAHDATKEKLANALRGAKPALVYTASHGLFCPREERDMQLRYNGAICCQASGPLTNELFTADDVPPDEPFLEGAVFFQFACYGYGTPAESDYAHWLDGVPERCAEADFVAALPKRLLAHPRGPVGYVGHLDTAFLHAFTDQDDPYIADRWHSRMQPFVHAVAKLLEVQPSGLAMENMNARYGANNVILTNIYDRLTKRGGTLTADLENRLLDTWIVRSDAQNYMVFGDPAAHLRIPAPD